MKYLILFLFLLVSNPNTCKTKEKVAENANKETENQIVQSRKFRILLIGDKDVSESKLHITFDDENNSASGFSGCNGFSCQYTIKDGQISFGFPIATKIYCENIMKLEDEFFKNLIESKVRTLSKDSLILKDVSGKALLTGVIFGN